MQIFKQSLLACLIFFAIQINAQKPIYLSLEGGLSFDEYQFITIDENFVFNKQQTQNFGLAVRPFFAKKWSAEIGLYAKQYEARVTNSTLAFNTLQVPIRIQLKERLAGERLFFTIAGGTSLYFSDQMNGISFDSNISTQTIEIIKEKPNLYLLAELGIRLEYDFYKSFSVGLGIRTYWGRNNITEYEIQYESLDEVITIYKLATKGSYQSINLSLSYLFNLSSKKDK